MGFFSGVGDDPRSQKAMSFQGTVVCYGQRMQRMKRGFRGLYGNRMIQYGNKVSHAENKTRRRWKPNTQMKSVYSKALDEMLRFRMTTHVMRTIDKWGGIDEYLMRAKDDEIKFPKALEYKRRILEVRDQEGTLPDVKELRARFYRGCKKGMQKERIETLGLGLAKRIGVLDMEATDVR